jgi:hypothetical protein
MVTHTRRPSMDSQQQQKQQQRRQQQRWQEQGTVVNGSRSG